MTADELHDLMTGDPASKAHADAGRDQDAADALAAALPKVARETRMTTLAIAGALGPELAGRMTHTINVAVQAGNALLGEIQWSLRQGGVDVGHPATWGTLDALVAVAVPGGLTAADAAAIKGLSLTAQVVTADQVSAAWVRYRPGGFVQAL